jgi:50S ribosomal protein L16 3-hydroxylase
MKGAFVDDIHGLARDNDYPFPSWNEMIELACDGTLEHNNGDVHGKRLYEGDFGDDVNDEVDYGDDCDDDDDDEYEHQYDAWVGDGDAVEAFESGNEGFYAWGDESQYDDDEDKSDNPPSRLIQYSWPRHVDSDYHSDVNTNWLDTFEIKQFGPFNDPDSLEALLRTEDEDNSERYAARTLLVNDVDRWFPKLSDWMDRRFNNNKSKGGVLPARWRRDDAQISLSYAKGGIGPHVDDYDVFLIQLAGERTWDVLWEESSHDGEELWFNTKGHGMSKISVRDETACILPESSTNGVRILNVTKLQALQKHLFTSSRTRLTRLHLRPGDCLYLPPRVLHCGTAVAASEDSMTLSVGCRAPSAVELLDGLSALMKKSATTPSPQTMASTGSTLPSDAAIQAFHRRYTNAEFGRNNSNHKDNAYISGEDVAVSKVLSSASQSSWLSPQVKNEMKNLVLKAVQTALDDDENVLDPLIGRFVTKSNRLEEMDFGPGDDSLLTSFSYPKALGSIIDDDLHGRDEGNGNDVWGNATTALQEVFGMTESKEGSEDSFLRRAEGVSFAWSCVCDLERRIRKYRLYAQGRPPFEVLEVTHEGTEEYHDSSDSFVSAPNSKVGRLMDQIANGPPLDRTFVVDELQILIDVKQKGTQHTITRLLYDLVEEGLLYGGYHSPYNS